MHPCATCGHAPCACPNPTILNQPRLLQPIVSGGTFTGGVFAGPTINGGTITGAQIVGATLDCATQGCTQAPGTCDASPATTAFVCVAIDAAVNAANPAFCAAVQTCLAGSPTLCAEIINCINTTPGSINNVIAFDPSVFATTLQLGVIRIATLGEVQGASCGLALDPCTLEAFWNAGGPNTLWSAFEAAVLGLLASAPGFCAQVFACGVAPIDSPAFTGDPQAPTPAPGDNDSSVATTQFVNTAIGTALASSIDSGNPVFCAAVAGCASAGGTFAASGTIDGVAGGSVATRLNCCTFAPGVGGNIGQITFDSPQPDTNYDILFGQNTSVVDVAGEDPHPLWANKTVNGFDLNIAYAAPSSTTFDFLVTRVSC